MRQEIHATSARLNAALDDLGARIAPLQEIWTREAAEAYRVEQAGWNQAASALNDILMRLGNAVRDGADEVAETDRHAANAWSAERSPRPCAAPRGMESPRGRAAHQSDCAVEPGRDVWWRHAAGRPNRRLTAQE